MIRRAVKEDCPRLMELIRELAVYERAPEEVTVSLSHFKRHHVAGARMERTGFQVLYNG